MPKVLISNIVDNMYRDRNLFPTDPAKIESLIESINQTGFWDNIMVRIQFNELADGTIIEGHEQLAELLIGGLDLTGEKLELAYGHHRLDALIEAGYTEIDIPVKFITDEDMMRIMANENKEGWGSGIKNKLETVRQVKGRLEDMFQDYAGYADYVATVGQDKVVFSKKQFQDAKTQGIGYRTVQSFLGDSWNPTDVRIPMAVFKAVEKGYFKQEDIFDFETLGILDSFTSCIVAMYEGGKVKQKVEVEKKDDAGKVVRNEAGEPVLVKVDKFLTQAAPNWPLGIKAKFTSKLIDQCLPTAVKDERGDEEVEFVKEATLTQTQLNKRRINMLAKQSAPTTGATKAFQLNKQLIRDFFPAYDPNTPNEEREALYAQLTGKDMETFKTDPGMADWPALPGVVAELLDIFECLKSPLSEDTPDDLQAEMDEEAGTSEDFESEYQDLEMDLEDEDEETGEKVSKPLGEVARGVVDLLNVAMTGVDNLSDRGSEIDLDEDVLLNEALRIALAKTSKLYAVAGSLEDLGMLFNEIMDTLQSGADTDAAEVSDVVEGTDVEIDGLE